MADYFLHSYAFRHDISFFADYHDFHLFAISDVFASIDAAYFAAYFAIISPALAGFLRHFAAAARRHADAATLMPPQHRCSPMPFSAIFFATPADAATYFHADARRFQQPLLRAAIFICRCRFIAIFLHLFRRERQLIAIISLMPRASDAIRFRLFR